MNPTEVQQALAETIDYLHNFDTYVEGKMGQQAQSIEEIDMRLRDQIYQLTKLTRELDSKQARELRRIKQVFFSITFILGGVLICLAVKLLT